MNGNLQDYHKLFDALHVMLFVIQCDGTIIAVNKAVLNRLGYTREDLIGTNVSKVHPVEAKEDVVSTLDKFHEGSDEVLCLLPILTKSGDIIETETRIYRGTWEGIPVLFGFCSDITEQRTTERKCEAIFRNSPVPILVSKVKGGAILDVNDAWCHLFWFKREDIIGKSTLDLGVWCDPAERDVVLGVLRRDGVVMEHPVTLCNKEGDHIYGFMSGTRITISGDEVWVTSLIDQTEQRLLEQQLDEIRELTLTSALEQLDRQMSTNRLIREGHHGV